MDPQPRIFGKNIPLDYQPECINHMTETETLVKIVLTTTIATDGFDKLSLKNDVEIK